MKKWIAATLAAVFCFCAVTACGNQGTGGSQELKRDSVTGWWESDVTGAEYLLLRNDGTYETFNEEGDARFSGSYLLDKDCVVLDGKDRKDESALMVLTYVDKSTLRYKGLVESDYTRVQGPPPASRGGEAPSEEPEPEPELVTGTLSAVFGAEYVLRREFGYEEGFCTPEEIAEALSAWTGLYFSVESAYDPEYGIYVIDWKSDSSLVLGEPQSEEFDFYDQDSLRWFMLNSLCRSVRDNMPQEVDVYYSIEGEDLNGLDLGADFNPSIPYNRMDDPRALG